MTKSREEKLFYLTKKRDETSKLKRTYICIFVTPSTTIQIVSSRLPFSRSPSSFLSHTLRLHHISFMKRDHLIDCEWKEQRLEVLQTYSQQDSRMLPETPKWKEA